MRALWPDRQNCSHNVSQKAKRVKCFSEFCFFAGKFGGIFSDPQNKQRTEKDLPPPPPREHEKKIFRGKLWLHPPLQYIRKCRKNSKTISTIAILWPWPVKVIFEKRAATVEVDTFIYPDKGSNISGKFQSTFRKKIRR